MRNFFLCLILFFCFNKIAFSESAQALQDEDSIDIYVLSIGLGESVDARFGHTIIQIINKKTGDEKNLNWGTFSFTPWFAFDFFLGRLQYWVSDNSTEATLRYYEYNQRSLVKDRLNLTGKQKHELLKKINHLLIPQNSYFWYHFFYKNCSTIPRDLIDEVLQGQLKKTFSARKKESTFRDEIRSHLNRPLSASFFLEVVLNSTIDYKISEWEEMYHPLKLRNYLLATPAYDDSLQEIKGQNLLSGSEVLLAGKDFSGSDFNYFPILSLVFLILWVLGITLLRKTSFKRLVAWPLGILLASLALFFGFMGLVMTLAWIFSDHEILKHNASLWLLWPTDFIYVKLAFSLARRRSFSMSRSMFFYTLLHVLCSVLCFILWRLGFIEQNLERVFWFALPFFAMLYLKKA